MFKLENILALIGLALIQGQNIPYIIAAINGDIPPTIAPAILLVIGLCLLQYYSIIRKDYIYIIGNSIGIVSSIILIALFFTI